MSVKSDQHEKNIANYINSLPGIEAERPPVGVHYPDVLIKKHKDKPIKKPVWVEIKMNHSDNLGNPRVYWNGSYWGAAFRPGEYSPLKEFAIEYLTQSNQAKEFLKEIADFSGIKKPKLPSTYGFLKKVPGSVPLEVIRDFFSNRTQYILCMDNIDLGELVTNHYLYGKREPAHYLQAGDDFYKIGKKNPLKLKGRIPKLKGIGRFRMRISIKSKHYEIHPEIKMTTLGHSNYSILPGSEKINPLYD